MFVGREILIVAIIQILYDIHTTLVKQCNNASENQSRLSLGSRKTVIILYLKRPAFLTSNEAGSSMRVSMFTKMLFLNFEKTNLEPEYWRRIDKITKEKILLNADSPEVKKHLTTADVYFSK